MAYDERHGYRGPLARVELPAGSRERGATAGARRVDAQALRALLDDYRPLLDYESAIVLAADDIGAECSSRPKASSRSASTPSSGPRRSSTMTVKARGRRRSPRF